MVSIIFGILRKNEKTGNMGAFYVLGNNEQRIDKYTTTVQKHVLP